MNVDYYDDDLPEPYMSWADSLGKQKTNIILLTKLVGVPTMLSLISFVVVRLIDRKIESL
jgi:hypothetical protein